MKVLFSDRANADVKKIYTFLLANSTEERAWSGIAEIFKHIQQVFSFEIIPKVPDLEFEDRSPRHYKILLRPYKITWIEVEQTARILRVFDTRQDPERNL